MKPFLLFAAALSACSVVIPLRAQSPAATATSTPSAAPETMLLTVFLRHDQTKTLDEINAHVEKTGFRKNFPPAGVEIVDYHILMGIGQVITLRLPPSKLREVNVLFEKGAWGAYKTEFYPTYDYLPVFRQQKQADAATSR